MIRTLVAAILLLLPGLALADVPGPIRATVLAIHDGDTFAARVEVWPGTFVETHVRVAGIDTPELHGKCPEEVAAAKAAAALASQLIQAGEVRLLNVRPDKYGGRVVADVEIGGQRLAEHLLAAGLAVKYDGGTKRPWCRAGP